eukprot:jgi/Psemu1/234427/estExt_Genewise1.C_150127
MSKPFDYSKWDKIELSDDEDDVHPNIDRESWFRMKHRSRVEREEHEEKDKKRINGEMDKANQRIKMLERDLKKIAKRKADDSDSDDDDDLDDTEAIKIEIEELQSQNAKRQAILDEYEKNKKWNVDNMFEVKEERTMVNKDAGKANYTSTGHAQSTVDSDPDFLYTYHEFTERYANLCEQFMFIKSFGDSKEFLLKHGTILLQEHAANYLLLATLEDEMNGKHDEMKQRAKQSQIVTNIAELAQSWKTHPGNAIIPFFTRLEQREFLEGFLAGVKIFVEKIEKRAIVKRKEIDAARAEEEEHGTRVKKEGVDLSEIPKEERLGPGGLDPLEVIESLPQSMQDAFESRDTDQLREALMAMDPKEAEYHMKRCVDSGLWNAG